MRVIIFFICVAIISCRDMKDCKIEYYPGGEIKAIKNYSDTLLNGESFWFYPNGNLEQKVNYLSGLANGYAYFFYESGALKSSRLYSEGKTAGFTTNYFDNSIGLIQSVMIFNDSGQLVYKKIYDTSGKVVQEEGKRLNY